MTVRYCRLPIYDSNQSRRDFLRLTASAGVGALIAGCGGSSAGAKPVRTLNFWGTATLDIGDWTAFREAAHGVVQFEDNQNDPGPVISKLVQAGEGNTRHISGLQGGAEKELASAGAIVPWNEKLIPSLTSMWEWARNISYSRVNGQLYGIPSVINADSMIYRTDRIPVVDSYHAVFDDAYRGRTSMEDAWINSVIFAAIYLKENQRVRIEDPGNLTESELKEVMRFLTEKAKAGQFRKLWRGWTDGLDLITSGQVWVMTGWEPIAIEAKRRGVSAEYAVPKEGYEGWSNDLLLHPGAAKAGVYDLAHQFIEWELTGYYGAKLVASRGYVVPTDDAIRYAELHASDFDPVKTTSAIENVKRKFFQMKGQVYWQNVRPDNLALYEQEWARFRAAF